MSTKLFVATGLALIVTQVSPTTSLAQTTGRTSFEEQEAVLAFATMTPIECEDGSSSFVFTDVFIAASSRPVVGESSVTSEAVATFTRRDGCTGQVVEAFPIVSDADFEASGTGSATLDVSFELSEFSTGEPLGFLDASLNFAGTGATTRILDDSTDCLDGLATQSRSRRTSRQATVAGSVVLDGADLLADVEFSAQLEASQTTERSTQAPSGACSCGGSAMVNADIAGADPIVAPPGASTVSLTTTDRAIAVASFRGVTPLVCDDGSSATLETGLSITASDQVTVGNADISSSSELSAFLDQVNGCTGESLVGFQLIPDAAFEQQGTEFASIDVTFELTDPGTGAFVGELDAGLVFTGIGGPSCSDSQSTTRTGDSLIAFRSNREARDANVSGTVSFNGEELVDGLLGAQLITERTSNLFVE